MNYRQKEAREFAERIKALGFVVYLAENNTYGFITDETGSRVMSFQFDTVSSLSGNYGPPSSRSGTGWRLEQNTYDLLTAEDVRQALYAPAPLWVGNGWKYYTTLEQHLKNYNASSRYEQI